MADRVRRVSAEGLVEAEVGAGGARDRRCGCGPEPAGGREAVATRFGVGDVVHVDEVLEQRACGRRVHGHGTRRGRQTPLQQRGGSGLAAEQPGGAPAEDDLLDPLAGAGDARWFHGGRCRPRDHLGGCPPPADGVDVERGVSPGPRRRGGSAEHDRPGARPRLPPVRARRAGEGGARRDRAGPERAGLSSMPSIPTRATTAASGNPVSTSAGRPWASAAANRLASIAPASHHRCSHPRSPYFQQVRKGKPVSTRVTSSHAFHLSTQRYQGVVEGVVVVVVDVVVNDVHLDRVQVAGRHPVRNQIEPPSVVRATPVTPAARNSNVPSSPSSSSSNSARRPDSTSAAGNDERRSSRDRGTASTPRYLSSVGWAGSSDPEDGTGAADQGGLGALRASSSDEEPRSTRGRSRSQSGASPRPSRPFALRGDPRCQWFVPNHTRAGLATYGVAAPIHRNRGAPHSLVTDGRVDRGAGEDPSDRTCPARGRRCTPRKARIPSSSGPSWGI